MTTSKAGLFSKLGALGLSLAAGLAISGPAHALSCDEIMNMVAVNVPTNIVEITVKESGEVFTSADIQCLESRGAPGEVISQAKTMTGGGGPDTSSGPDVSAPPPPTGSAIDQDEDVLGTRATKRSSTADDLPEKGEAEGNDPARVKEAIKLYRAKKYLTASLMLYEMLEDGTYPEATTKIHYYLGRCLEALEMYHTAQYHYMAVIKKGTSNPYFNYALPKLVKIARFTGDDTELKRVVAKIPAEAYPRNAKNHLYYLAGVRHYDRDELSQARKSFGMVSTKSPLFLKSEYFRGVIYNQQGRLKSSVRSFRDVYREEPADYGDKRYLEEVEDLKDLALINVARIYYGIERYDESHKYYKLVSRKSGYWPESMMEDSWAQFMQNNLNETLGLVLTVHSSFFRDEEWLPEAAILRSLTFFNLCEYDLVEGELLEFEKNHRAMVDEMTGFVTTYNSKEGRALSDQAWNTYFGRQGKTETLLPKSLFNKILRNRDLAGVIQHMDMMDQELAQIDQQKSKWRDSVGAYLTRIIEADRQRYESIAGKLLVREMAKHARKLSDLLTQSEIIRFEVVDAQRVDYAYKASNVDIGDSLGNIQLDFATQVEYTYWPFNGEFWEDELGFYHYTEQSSCK